MPLEIRGAHFLILLQRVQLVRETRLEYPACILAPLRVHLTTELDAVYITIRYAILTCVQKLT